jgi:hypothetical protein
LQRSEILAPLLNAASIINVPSSSRSKLALAERTSATGVYPSVVEEDASILEMCDMFASAVDEHDSRKRIDVRCGPLN